MSRAGVAAEWGAGGGAGSAQHSTTGEMGPPHHSDLQSIKEGARGREGGGRERTRSRRAASQIPAVCGCENSQVGPHRIPPHPTLSCVSSKSSRHTIRACRCACRSTARAIVCGLCTRRSHVCSPAAEPQRQAHTGTPGGICAIWWQLKHRSLHAVPVAALPAPTSAPPTGWVRRRSPSLRSGCACLCEPVMQVPAGSLCRKCRSTNLR
jgi:hypothetical protein